MKTVAFYTLGCKLNFSETSSISRAFLDNGFSKLDFKDGADVYVINTCSVTDNADKKCRRVVKEALKYNPKAFIAIIGCYAQLKPEEIKTTEHPKIMQTKSNFSNLDKTINEIEKIQKLIKEGNQIKLLDELKKICQ